MSGDCSTTELPRLNKKYGRDRFFIQLHILGRAIHAILKYICISVNYAAINTLPPKTEADAVHVIPKYAAIGRKQPLLNILVENVPNAAGTATKRRYNFITPIPIKKISL